MSHMALLFLLVGVLVNTVTVSTGDVLPVTVKQNVNVGGEVTLNCSMSETIRDMSKVTVEWKREYSSLCVLMFRGGEPYNDEQDPHFKGRVAMVCPDLKHGNLSMVLKNAMKTDNGIYKCFFIRKSSESPQSSRKKRAADEILLVTYNLEVKDKPVSGGQMGEGPVGEDEGSQNRSNPGLVGGLVFVGVIAVGVIAVAFLHRFKKSENYQKENSHNVKKNPEQDPLSDTTPPV